MFNYLIFKNKTKNQKKFNLFVIYFKIEINSMNQTPILKLTN